MNQSVSATCTDNAGNVSQPSTVSGVNIDKTPPVITGSRSSNPNKYGWNNTNVTVSFTCADTGPVQSGIDQNTVAGGTISSEGANQSLTDTGTCTDKAGNVAAPATVSAINIDKTPPVFGPCPVAGPFLYNSGAQSVGSILATDTLSGLAPTGNQLSGSVDTSSVGSKNVTFTAVDQAGNTATQTCAYSVIPSATIKAYTALHKVGSGPNPGANKTALAVTIKVFDLAKVGSPDPTTFGTIWTSGPGLTSPITIISGPQLGTFGGGQANLYSILVPATDPANTVTTGSYLVIGKATVTVNNVAVDVYVGSPTDPLTSNSVTQKYLQFIQNANGQLVPATTTAIPGTLLLIAEPAYLEFTSSTDLLPIIYESIDGDWSDTVQANPPSGFVSTPGVLSVSVTTSQLQAVQFTVNDVGSDWTFTKVTHHIKHKGKEIAITHNLKMINHKKK